MKEVKFNENLRELIKNKGLTQNDFANEMGIHSQVVYRYTNGVDFPRLERVCKIAKYFNVTLEELIFGKENN